MESKIIPFVITWNGMVTQFNKKYRKLFDIDKKVFSYIILKKTFEIMVNGNNKFDVMKCRKTIEDYLEETINVNNNDNIEINEENFNKQKIYIPLTDVT